jgi:hypothetical protein
LLCRAVLCTPRCLIRHDQLTLANLGDSGCIVLRPSEAGKYAIVFRTKEQQRTLFYLISEVLQLTSSVLLFNPHVSCGFPQTISIAPINCRLSRRDGSFPMSCTTCPNKPTQHPYRSLHHYLFDSIIRYLFDWVSRLDGCLGVLIMLVGFSDWVIGMGG